MLNESVYNALPADQQAAIDAASGMSLSKSAEDAWLVTANAAMDAARADSNNTVIDLSEAEAAAFADAVAGVVDAYVTGVDGSAALAAMRGE